MRERERKLFDGINTYYVNEWYEELSEEVKQQREIPLAYTTYLFDDSESWEHEIQVTFDTGAWAFKNYIDGNLVEIEQRAYSDNVGEEIACCSFEDIIRACIDKGFDLYG